MLLVIDIGNTNTVIGVYDKQTLIKHWRLESSKKRTSDEYGFMLTQLFHLSKIQPGMIKAGIIASVVPPLNSTYRETINNYFHVDPLEIGPGIRTGMPILYENPREVGADRIINAIAAFERYKQACIIVDFGTATTFEAVTKNGEYLGGVIAPGIGISMDALFHQAAKLPRVSVSKPKRVIGRNTVASMQSGLVFGYVGLVDGIVTRMVKELNKKVKICATGGLAELMASESETIETVEPFLTLEGLKIVFERNRG